MPTSYLQVCFQECTARFNASTAFGLGNGTSCICQGSFPSNDYLALDEMDGGCDLPCGGYMAGIMCGGHDTMSVFSVE